ncbi:MAG: TRAP transporter small permease subunit [Rhodobacteraceae bacterium]|jgi:TRAP-type C4-dicarboxylate transport system permease small subunit|nr:TRAP transporter small permease subunit [Paracoccaceae bacterium]
MGVLIGAARALAAVNGALSVLGLWLGAACVALMVVFILAQVWYRYVIGAALPWSEEAARFLMLWMVGLMAPTAYRRGGFVAIDMLVAAMPKPLAALLQIVLLGVSTVVLVVAFRIGLSELSGLGARFATSALWYPSGLFPLEWAKVPRGWMMMSFHLCVSLLLLVNAELILRALARLGGAGDRLPAIREEVALAGAE